MKVNARAEASGRREGGGSENDARLRSAVARLAYRPGEAAAALGVSKDFFDEHVAGELRWVRRGALKLVSVEELGRWLRENAALVLGEDR